MGNALQACRHIDPIAKNILTFDDHIAKVYPDPELDETIPGQVGVPDGNALLNVHRAGNGVHHTWELRQDPVSSRFKDTASLLSELWIHQPGPDLYEYSKRAGLVRAHEPAITYDIGCKNAGKASLNTFFGHIAQLLDENTVDGIGGQPLA
jgi:hypothetical protein